MRREYFIDDHHRSDPSKWELNALHLREHVIKTSGALLKEVGPRGFTVVEVAERSEVARTTIYKYFGTKAGLLAACRDYSAHKESRSLKWSGLMTHERTVRARNKKGQLPPALEAVRQIVLTLVDHLQDQSDLFLLAGAEAIRSIRRPHGSLPDYGLLPAGIPRQFFRSVLELLTQGMTAGELKAGLEPQRLAAWLQAFWWQELCLRGPRQDQAPPERERLAVTLDQFLKLIAAA